MERGLAEREVRKFLVESLHEREKLLPQRDDYEQPHNQVVRPTKRREPRSSLGADAVWMVEEVPDAVSDIPADQRNGVEKIPVETDLGDITGTVESNSGVKSDWGEGA